MTFKLNHLKPWIASLALTAAIHATPVTNTANDHLYDIVTAQNISWSLANLSAQSDGWSLATITNSAEQNFIAGLITSNQGFGEYWLGGYQNVGTTSANSNWNWVTGEKFKYTDWAPTEPNDHTGPGSEQNLAIWGLGHGTASLEWNDEGNVNNITGYIIERSAPAVPEPGSLALMGAGMLALAFSVRRRKA
jgi:hypothetical protein